MRKLQYFWWSWKLESQFVQTRVSFKWPQWWNQNIPKFCKLGKFCIVYTFSFFWICVLNKKKSSNNRTSNWKICFHVDFLLKNKMHLDKCLRFCKSLWYLNPIFVFQIFTPQRRKKTDDVPKCWCLCRVLVSRTCLLRLVCLLARLLFMHLETGCYSSEWYSPVNYYCWADENSGWYRRNDLG